MHGRKILGVLRLRARQLKGVEYLGGATLRMTGINILLEYKLKDLLHPGVDKVRFREKSRAKCEWFLGHGLSSCTDSR
jgi:hypothetical protein